MGLPLPPLAFYKRSVEASPIVERRVRIDAVLVWLSVSGLAEKNNSEAGIESDSIAVVAELSRSLMFFGGLTSVITFALIRKNYRTLKSSPFIGKNLTIIYSSLVTEF